MSAASLFATRVLIRGTTWYAITLQFAATSPAVGVALRTLVGVMPTIVALLASAALEGLDRTRATAIGIALAAAGNAPALDRSVKSRT